MVLEKGFVARPTGKVLAEYFLLSSDLVTVGGEEAFQAGLACSHMDLINACLIAAYDKGGASRLLRVSFLKSASAREM